MTRELRADRPYVTRAKAGVQAVAKVFFGQDVALMDARFRGHDTTTGPTRD